VQKSLCPVFHGETTTFSKCQHFSTHP
jgi:hypothetical protein